MNKTLPTAFFVVLWHFAMFAHGAGLPATGMWETNEMNPRVNDSVDMFQIKNVNLLPAGAPNPGDRDCATLDPCTFNLFYTTGTQFGQKKDGLNILFIPGGPGVIVKEAEGPGGCKVGETPEACSGEAPMGNEVLNKLALGDKLDGRHNLIYVHVRGTGQSMIDRRNSYDQFLRAKFVVDDIERLRKELLQDKPWDAIYAHSWGTVVAQLYAARKFENDPGPKVKSLILSAPIVRRDAHTLEARVRQTVSNLEDIYRFFRPPGACAISGASYLESLVADFNDEAIRDLEPTDNLCFITDKKIAEILDKVARIIHAVEEDYGSLSFAEEHYKAVKANLPRDLKRLPQEFFSALRKLQFLGAPNNLMKRKRQGLLFTADAIQMVDAALTIGYHLTGGFDPSLTKCDPASRFFVGPAARVKRDYCARLKNARDIYLMPNRSQSVRASAVFGVYDGVARWVPRMLNKEDCFTQTDLSNFANAKSGKGDKKGFLRDFAKRIGLASKDEASVCGWDPGGANAQGVPTLVLAGDADTVIAGCQAEDFYNRGLKGRKVFLQIPGQGHDMSINDQHETNRQLTKAMAELLDKFIRAAESPSSEFESFIGSVKSELELVKAVATSAPDIPCR